MARYESAFATSLGDFMTVNELTPKDVEIGAIVAQVSIGRFHNDRTRQDAISQFNAYAYGYDAVVDLRENLASGSQGSILSILFGSYHASYVIRGTGVRIRANHHSE